MVTLAGDAEDDVAAGRVGAGGRGGGGWHDKLARGLPPNFLYIIPV